MGLDALSDLILLYFLSFIFVRADGTRKLFGVPHTDSIFIKGPSAKDRGRQLPSTWVVVGSRPSGITYRRGFYGFGYTQ